MRCVATDEDGLTVLSFPGTDDDPRTWARDVLALPTPDPDLGLCHEEFLHSGRVIFSLLRADVAGRRLACVGHSLGGATAIVVAGLLTVAGTTPEALVTFGAPRACYSGRLPDLLGPVPRRTQFRDGPDPMTEVPPFGRHVVDALTLIVPPAPLPHALDYHRVAAYRAALAETARPTVA